MHWNDDVGFTFCEGKYLRNMPVDGVAEFANSLSSLSMVVFGLLGLYGSLHSGVLPQMLNSLLVINGIGSILFHATLSFGWELIDEVPMLLMMTIGNIAVIDLVLRRFVKDKGYETTYHILTQSSMLLFCTYGVFTITLDATNENPTLFRLLFASPYIILLICMLILYFTRRELKTDSEILNSPKSNVIYNSWYVSIADSTEYDLFEREIYSLVWLGIGSGLFAMACWLSDTLLCNDPWVSYIRLHAFWHLLISYATHCQLSLAGYLRAKATDRQAKLVWIARVIPLVQYHF